MGRVAKYKKVKSCDPYSKKNRGNIDLASVGVWGLGDNGRRVKKRSLKAQKLHAKKNKNRKRSNDDADDGFDVPPTDGDEFDLADLVGSVRRRSTANYNDNNNNNNKELLLGGGGSSDASRINNHDDNKINSNSNNDNDSKHEKQNDKNHHPPEESYDRVVTVASATASASNGNLVVANIPRTDADEQAVERLLRVDKQFRQRSLEEKQKNYGRMEGESKRAYAKRTLAETRQIIKKSTLAATTNQEKRLKKKEFLSNKKKNKNKKRRMENGTNNEFVGFGLGDNGNGNDNDRHCEIVGFGEQADRPPVFRQLPRGAKTREAKAVATSTVRAHNKNNTTKGIMTEDQVAAESNAMELMRRRVQAQYRAIKSKRRAAGDFHL
eukprot:CAMPEP_0172356830 /NCGR_PEP_ID=MMETSP1060-20121228/1235_1 /TAXON_ID=37318 /ORGANISM="Pseudo-nitzschia pungens, Strain cf. cingulata" /LENGTH=380 /DNA_ID=CAMNT_0013077207 /DNA_START=143 /DNA_END=1285 /DNA_ORIENTATION=+